MKPDAGGTAGAAFPSPFPSRRRATEISAHRAFSTSRASPSFETGRLGRSWSITSPSGLGRPSSTRSRFTKALCPRSRSAKRDPPALGAEVLRRRNRLEEQLVDRSNVVLAAPEPGGVRRTGEIRMRRQDVRDQGLAEELVNALP